MIGLLITTYNRPEYLIECFKSVLESDLNASILVCVVDDCSDKNTMDLIHEYGVKILERAELKVFRKTERSGICSSLSIGYEYLFKTCTEVINLDSDAIISNDFFSRLKYLRHQHPNKIITGFNSIVKNSRGAVRHPIVSDSNDGYCFKKSCGGINLMVNKPQYLKFISPSLEQVDRTKKGNWDTVAMGRYAGLVVVAKPSIVQHLGVKSAMNHHENPCVSHDFVKERKETVVINQYFGLGDILFCINIANDFIKKGHDVYWMVEPQFLNIQKHFPQIKFVDKSELRVSLFTRHEINNGIQRIIPLRFSQDNLELHVRECMKSKYMMFGRDWNDWIDFEIIRDTDNEKRLLNLLGIKKGDKFALVNRNFRTSPIESRMQIKTDLKIVEMDIIEGFTMIDWSAVLEIATEIHTVSTSLIYLMEKLDLKGRNYIYKRLPLEKTHENYDYILKRNKYILV